MMKFVALLFFVALVAADIAPLLHADGPDVVPNSYIIVLKDHLTKSHRDEHIARLQYNISYTGANAKIGYVYNVILAFHAILDSDLLKEELKDPEVKYIEAVQVYKINVPPQQKKPIQNFFDSLSQPNATWGLVRVSERTLNLKAPYTYNSAAGKGVDVYVIDTGILASHVDFGGRVTNAFTSIKNEANTDLNGHGTHCAGTIGGTTYGVAKNVTLFAVKVLSASGSGTTDGVIAGVDYVHSNKRPDVESVASMSLGGGASTALDNAIIKAIDGGSVFVVAAGNDNAKACNYSPARVLQAITVGATTNTDARSSFSNYGSCVDIFAPGSSITSDWIGNSNTTTNTISGTSMATPHVAGIVALHLSFNIDTNPAATKAWLIGASTPNVVTNPGADSPNRLAYSPAQ